MNIFQHKNIIKPPLLPVFISSVIQLDKFFHQVHVHVFSAHLSLVADNIIVKDCAQPGNRACKTPDIRMDTLQTAITGMANINGYHQLGLYS